MICASRRTTGASFAGEGISFLKLDFNQWSGCCNTRNIILKLTSNWLTIVKAATSSFFSLGQVLKTNWTYPISFMINWLFPNLFKFQVYHARNSFGNQITKSSWKAWQHWLTSSIIHSFFVQLNWTVLTWPVVFSRHLWKTRLWTVGSCAVASLGDIPRHLRKKSVPTRCPWEAARRWFLLVLQSLCMDLQNSNGKLLNLVFLKNCSMLVLKLEILIQNRRALIAVLLLLFYPGARACCSFINTQNWIHKQNFVEFRSKLLEHERFEVCIS